jgi:sulfite oxidase
MLIEKCYVLKITPITPQHKTHTRITTRMMMMKRLLRRQQVSNKIRRFYTNNNQHHHHHHRSNYKLRFVATSTAAATTAFLCYQYYQQHQQPYQSHNTNEFYAEEEKVAARDEYTRAQVAEHKTKQSRIWVTYKDGVYDITDFVDKHPGGEKIMLAAGSAIDPFWTMYANHMKPDIRDMLEVYRIGDLKASELTNQSMRDSDDPYGNDPERLPVLKVNSEKPFNAETPAAILVDKFLTPNEIFYVRNHLPVPLVTTDTYELIISGNGVRDVKFTIDELKKFKQCKVVTTMQCAGNRRKEMSDTKPVKGLDWTIGAIGTAEWTGVKLRDLLQFAGLDADKLEFEDDPKIQHVQFEGLDQDVTGSKYGGSIPISKVVDPHGDVIIAYQMNGVDIPRDHGYPLRAIVPGIVGARNVKWLSKIIVSDEESQTFWQQKDYRGFNPSADFGRLDYSKAPAIQDLPVQSAICDPQDGSTVKAEDEQFLIKGYAWSGGGRDIIRVDITPDHGKTWIEADLKKENHQMPGRAWAWTPFEATVNVPAEEDMTVCSKAVDSAYSVQPEHVESIWNARGFLNNVWSCVKLHIDRTETPEDDEE